MHINQLELSCRAHNALERAGIETVEQLIKIDWIEFAAQPAVGAKTIAELASKMICLFKGEMLKEADSWNNAAWRVIRLEKAETDLSEIRAIVNGR